MARFFKNRIFWFIVYGVFITCVFLYLLFPSELVKPDLEAAASSADYAFRTKTLRLSLPLGVKLGEASVYAPPSSPNAVFHGKWLDAQLLPWSVLGKIRQIRFKGEAYGGRFSGNAGLLARGGRYWLSGGRIVFQGIDLASYGNESISLLHGARGKLKGNLSYEAGGLEGRRPSGSIYLYLTGGTYPLAEPFLGMTNLEFDRGELRAQMQNGNIMVDKFEAYGKQVNCFLHGEIQLNEPLSASRLNLKGKLELPGKSKVKMNITIGGTLANPSFHYI
ncbi:MAG TPA: type II secretion system protein GspN [Smithellaceae bacterium]|nr:type II secretion system protein GspN [Smithellaceae bacterium]HQF84175.1 type II secretion system protein GspN [Smithellaceae bacterium]HQG79955.1 type II secretion system protein GspN [Smithellaceae bacterium]